MMILRATFLLTATTLSWGAAAQSRTAEGFVQSLFEATDLEQMTAVIVRDADVAYLMASALGGRVDAMSEEELRRFAKAFRVIVAQEALALATDARGGRFVPDGESRTADGVVVTGELQAAGASARNLDGALPVEVLVRQAHGSRERVGDLRVGEGWASDHFADVVDQIMAIAGEDVETMLEALEGAVVER